MSGASDEFRLEDIITRHRIGTGLFIPFTTLRLGGGSDRTEAVWTISLRDVGIAGEQRRSLRFRWSPENVPSRPPGVADHTVTEWAALGVACSLVARYTTFHIWNTAPLGDCFDYWLTDGQDNLAMEVSGTRSGELEIRHRLKVEQWRRNPHCLNGLVIVCGFDSRQAIFSFHRYPEARE
jgi:hypothetical protein